MLRRTLLSSAAALTMLLTALPAKAEVSLMYAEWLASLVEPGIAAFEKETGEKVNAIKLPGAGYDQRISLDLAAGTAADVIQMDRFMVSEFASAGYLEPLNEQAKGWDQFQYYMPGLLEVASYDGKVYALPTDTDVRMLWYDKSNFEKAGIADAVGAQELGRRARCGAEAQGCGRPVLLPAARRHQAGRRRHHAGLLHGAARRRQAR